MQFKLHLGTLTPLKGWELLNQIVIDVDSYLNKKGLGGKFTVDAITTRSYFIGPSLFGLTK